MHKHFTFLHFYVSRSNVKSVFSFFPPSGGARSHNYLTFLGVFFGQIKLRVQRNRMGINRNTPIKH